MSGASKLFGGKLRAQEMAHTREMDKHAIKTIRDSLKGTNALEEARGRIEAALAKECDGDVLAEVSAARTAGKFKEEDLPVQPITLRPVMYKPKTKIGSEHDEFLQHIDVPLEKSGMDVASDGYHALTRGRYRYLNDFMETMQVDDLERRPMSKRELHRLEKHLKASQHNILYVAGSFVAGTALLSVVAFAGWQYTKYSMGVKDSAEYAARMRELTPDMKKDMQESAVGKFMRRFRSGMQSWIHGSSFQKNMEENFGGMATAQGGEKQ